MPPTPAPSAAPAAPKPTIELKSLESMVDNALKAYNEGNFKAFYADFAKKTEKITTEQVFKMLYGDETKAKLGKFVKRLNFLKDQSVLSGEMLVGQWEAEFEKKKNAKLLCSLLLEEGKHRFLQISLDA